MDGGWVLNGCKRWIGNATFADVVVVWARNLNTKQINAFVVRKGTQGFVTTKIENKIALRCVQNADIKMTDVFVPDSARLTGVNSFQVICTPGHPLSCACVHAHVRPSEASLLAFTIKLKDPLSIMPCHDLEQ